MKKIHNTITYDETTEVVSGSLSDYTELNKLHIGSTKNVYGSCRAIENFLTNTGSEKMKAWGKSRLDFIFKHDIPLRVKGYEATIPTGKFGGGIGIII
jgi:hypothetical protein